MIGTGKGTLIPGLEPSRSRDPLRLGVVTEEMAACDASIDFDCGRRWRSPNPVLRDTIGPYRLIYPLAAGGMATVFVARQTQWPNRDGLVAVKILHPHLAADDGCQNMFLDEGQLAGSISHDNVARTYDVGCDDGLPFIVGELVRGQNLGRFLQRLADRRLALGQGMGAHIGAQICAGLHAAHEAKGHDGAQLGLIHRDISPSNVLIADCGAVKLIDFGVAWARERIGHTLPGTIKGKLDYMSPEQMSGVGLDRRSDLFAVGVLLHLLVTGVLPYGFGSVPQRLTRIMAGPGVAPRQRNPALAPAFEGVILRALSADPNDRFTTAAMMGSELAKVARSCDEDISADRLALHMSACFADEQARHHTLVLDSDVGSGEANDGLHGPVGPTLVWATLLAAVTVLAVAVLALLWGSPSTAADPPNHESVAVLQATEDKSSAPEPTGSWQRCWVTDP